MPNLTDERLILKQYLELQGKVLFSFSGKYPDLKDFKFLTDFPSKGELIVEGDIWDFARHGVGVSFKRRNAPRYVVDVHANFQERNFLDEWRMIQFFESIDQKNINANDFLLSLEKSGLLVAHGSGFMSLC